MGMRASSSVCRNLLFPDSPSPPSTGAFARQQRSRGLWFFPFCITMLVLVAVIGFPERIEELHCRLGLRQGCSAQVAISHAVMYNRAAIRNSCTPNKEGGKVVLVTGSAGFIGYWASLRLRERGDGVVGIDNFNEYYPVSLKHARAAELATAGVHTVHGDINSMSTLMQVFEVRRAHVAPVLSLCQMVKATATRQVSVSSRRIERLRTPYLLAAQLMRSCTPAIESCTQGRQCRACLQICRPTHVLHLAAQAGVRYANVKPLNYLDANVHGTTVLLEAVKKQKHKPFFIYASSSSVYGGNSQVPFSEEDRVDNPLSLYAATKRACELLAGVYHGIADISVTGLRFFTVYGPLGRPDMAALAFAHQIASGHPVKIFQGPGQVELARDFTYIDDIIEVRCRHQTSCRQQVPSAY